MGNTQRFAIWHPLEMPMDVIKPAPGPNIPEPPQGRNENIEGLVDDFRLTNDLSYPAPPPELRDKSVSSYARPVVAPQRSQMAMRQGKAEEDHTKLSSYGEEVTKTSPVKMRNPPNLSPPQSILSSTPVDSYSLAASLAQLPEEAFDSAKLAAMEASIRRLHLFAANADIQLARKLCSIVGTANFGEKRQVLINEHDQSMEAVANSVLADLNTLHDQLEDKRTVSSRSLLEEPQQTPSPPWRYNSARKGQFCFSLVGDISSNPAHVSPTTPCCRNTPYTIPDPLLSSALAPAPAPTSSSIQIRQRISIGEDPYSQRQAAATVTDEDVVEGQEGSTSLLENSPSPLLPVQRRSRPLTYAEPPRVGHTALNKPNKNQAR